MVAGLVYGLMRPWGNRLPYAVCAVLCLAGLILLARSPVIVSTSVGND
jgi:hypothetical protein